MKPRSTCIAIIVGVMLLAMLAACGAPLQSARPAQAAPIARAFTPLPAQRAAAPAAVPPAQRPAPTTTPQPVAIVANAAPAPAAPALNELGRSIDTYMQSIVDAQWFHGTILVAYNGQV